MGYEIVTAKTIKSLVKKVNLLQSQSWITQGGVIYSPKDKLYMQSMITIDTFDNNDYDETLPEEEVMVVGSWPFEEQSPPVEWDPVFWEIVKNKFSKEGRLFIYKSNIHSPKELLNEMKKWWFEKNVGVDIMTELRGFIKKYNWVDE
jgi:hypothetical protein